MCIYAPEGCQKGTHNGDGLHARHLLESTHTSTHNHKQTHSAARQSTVRAHAVDDMWEGYTTAHEPELDT